MLLSVIVPVYNAEVFLPRCLDSLLHQGLSEDEMEIVCVDDGSTDGSLALLHSYAKTYSRIRVIEQPHAGPGMTRNVALQHVRGEVITFCDADDYLIPEGLHYVIEHFWDDQTDVICHASTTLDDVALKTWTEHNDPSGKVLMQGTGREVYERSPKYFVWNTLIRKGFIDEHQLSFRSMLMTEDSYFMLELLMLNPRTKDVSSNIYRYMVNQNQLTRQRDEVLMRQCIESYLVFVSRLQHYGLDTVIRTQLTPFYSRVFSAHLNYLEFGHLKEKLKEMRLPVCPFFIYEMLSWLHRKIFVPHVLPRLARGK